MYRARNSSKESSVAECLFVKSFRCFPIFMIVSILALVPKAFSQEKLMKADPPSTSSNASSLEVTWSNNLLSVKARGVELADLFKVIGVKAMVPVEVDPGIIRKVTIEIKNQNLEEGINKILEVAEGKNLAVEYVRKPGTGKDEFKVNKITVVRKGVSKEQSEAEIMAAIRKRDQEYREFFDHMDKEKNKIARALKEYKDPNTSKDRKTKLRTYLRQTTIDDPEDKKLLKGALLDPENKFELVSDLQMALMHAMQDHPEESDKEYILELLKRKDNRVGWLYYAMLNVWDDRYVPFLIEGAKAGSGMNIEILGRVKVKESVPYLEEALKSEDPIQSQAAFDALKHITGKKYEYKFYHPEKGKNDPDIPVKQGGQ